MLYKIALFLHVTGSLMLCGAIAIEWLCLVNIRKTEVIESVKQSIINYSKLSVIGPIAIGLILIPGIYMMAAVWHGAAWILMGFLGLVFIGVLGGSITGRKMRNIKKMLSNESVMEPKLKSSLTDKALLFSIKIRTTIFLGIIFLMTIKPALPGSLITLAASIALGFVPLKAGIHTREIKNVKHELN